MSSDYFFSVMLPWLVHNGLESHLVYDPDAAVYRATIHPRETWERYVAFLGSDPEDLWSQAKRSVESGAWQLSKKQGEEINFVVV